MSVSLGDLLRNNAPDGEAAFACQKLCDAAVAAYTLEQARAGLSGVSVASDSAMANVPNAKTTDTGISV